MQLENKIALVTGAGRGIGRAIALAYAKEGARLSLAARTLSELEETARQTEELGAEVLIIRTDVSDQAQVEEMVRRTVDRYSTVDILVNNAGVSGPIGPLQDNDVSYWIRTIQVNLIGTYLCCRAVLAVMLQQDRGKIINMSGGHLGVSSGYPYVSAYNSSKAAIIRLTEDLSQELAGKNIQVNVMGPSVHLTRLVAELRDGFAAAGVTERLPCIRQHVYAQLLARFGVHSWSAPMERLAELAVFLASDASGDLSGRHIDVLDDFLNLSPKIPEIMASDAHTLRRVEMGSAAGLI